MLPNTNSPSTTLEGPSSTFLHSPDWPFVDDVDEELFMSHLLSQHHSLSSMNNAPVAAAPAGEREQVYVANGADLPTTRANMITEGNSIALKAMNTIPKKRKHGITKTQQQKKIQIPSKKTGKKDRHSKICTAQGLRDRRMRLSLKVARKFFDLQDMLGFDKASKTIEWLLMNCKAAIQQLSHSQLPQNTALINKHISNGGEKSMSFSASEESEVESEAKKMETSRQAGEEEPLVGEACRGKRKRRKSCKVAAMITNHLARESRDKARARARQRTRQKLLMISGLDRKENTQSTKSNPQISKDHHLHAAAEYSGNSSPQADLFEEPQASVAVMDELMGITRSSSSSTFSYNSPDFTAALSGSNHSNEFPGFLPIQKVMEEARIEPAAGCYAMTSKKPSLGNVQVQSIPDAMFRTSLNAQKYDKLPSAHPSSTFMAISDGGQWNPSSIFALDQENPFPSSILMTRTSNALEGILTTPVFTATSSNASSFQSHFPGNHFQ